MQMLQLPLIAIVKKIGLHEKYPLMANLIFWSCLMIGLPLIAILYSKMLIK